MRESFFDKIVLGLTVLYFFGRGIATQRWEFITPVAWAVCLIVVYHAFEAAAVVSAEINREITQASGEKKTSILSPSGEPATVIVTSIKPRSYRVQLYGAATVVFALCGWASYSIWHMAKGEKNVLPPPVPGPIAARYATIVMQKFEPIAADKAGKKIPFVVGKPLGWNIVFINSGNDGATTSHGDGRVMLGPNFLPETVRMLSVEFMDWWRTDRGQGGYIAPGSQPQFFTAFGPVTTRELLHKLTTGEQTLYIFAAQNYEDQTGKYEVHYCRVLEPLKDQQPLIWHVCDFEGRMSVPK